MTKNNIKLKKSTTPESVENWISSKPFWEQYIWKQYIWKLNLEKDSLTEDDLDKCYEYLCEHLELTDKLAEEKPVMSFKKVMGSIQDVPALINNLVISEIENIVDVNAFSSDCRIKLGLF